MLQTSDPRQKWTEKENQNIFIQNIMLIRNFHL